MTRSSCSPNRVVRNCVSSGRAAPLWGAQKNRSRLPEFVTFVGEADRDEVLEEIVEAFDIAGRVGREVLRPLDGPPEGGIRPAFSV